VNEWWIKNSRYWMTPVFLDEEGLFLCKLLRLSEWNAMPPPLYPGLPAFSARLCMHHSQVQLSYIPS
jgi:hypothetical protein